MAPNKMKKAGRGTSKEKPLGTFCRDSPLYPPPLLGFSHHSASEAMVAALFEGKGGPQISLSEMGLLWNTLFLKAMPHFPK